MGARSLHGPSVASGAVRRVVTHAVARGVAEAELARVLGAPCERLADPTARLPLARLLDLWAHLARALGDPALPIRVAEDATLEDLDVLGFAVLTAPTLEVGLRAFVRYAPLLTTSATWTIAASGPWVEARLHRSGSGLGLRLSDETALAQFVRCMRQLAGPGFEPREVRFRHAGPAIRGAHASFFRAPVRFDRSATSVVFAREVLDAAPPSSNRAIHRYVCRDAELRLAAVAPAGPVVTVTMAIERALDAGRAPDLEGVARALATSERTLRRRLHDENTSFRALVEAARRARAADLLGDARRALSEVAFGSGFSDMTAFSHACRRWFGRSPRALRQSMDSSMGTSTGSSTSSAGARAAGAASLNTS